MTPLDDFLIRAAIAGIGVALAAGPLGCFVVWRRMAYFGDATAHAALLGVTLALALELPVVAGIGLSSLAMALAVSAASGRTYAMDTMLGVASHAALAAGLVAVSFIQGVRVDLIGYLFGDILAVTRADLGVIYAGAALVAALLLWRWKPLLVSTLDEDLAAASGYAPARERLILTLALAVLVAVSIKVVGALLITAMLIVPAAAARPIARTPERMAALAAIIGSLSVLLGIAGSWRFDTPTGPSIVVAAVACLIASNLVSSIQALKSGSQPPL
jgi:zinc transport system permease protein